MPVKLQAASRLKATQEVRAVQDSDVDLLMENLKGVLGEGEGEGPTRHWSKNGWTASVSLDAHNEFFTFKFDVPDQNYHLEAHGMDNASVFQSLYDKIRCNPHRLPEGPSKILEKFKTFK